jgi:hypothetical protein
MSNGRGTSNVDAARIARAGKAQLGESGRTLSDADRAFIARMERARESGKAISDVDQKRYERLTGKNWPGGGRTVSDRDLPGGRTVSDRDLPSAYRPRKKGGSVKKYAKGGGVRKARYK